MSIYRQLIISVLLVCLMFSAGGCLFGGNKNVTITGTQIDSSDLSRVKIGQTERSEVISLFGAPTSTWKSSDKVIEKLTYKHTENVRGQASLIFIFTVNDNTNKTSSVVFSLRNGVVESYWKQ